MGFTGEAGKAGVTANPWLAAGEAAGNVAVSAWGAYQAKKAAEKDAKANRQMTREERLLDLITRAAEVADRNASNKQRAENMLPWAQEFREKLDAPPPMTELRNRAAGAHNASLPGGGDPGVSSLITGNMQQFQAQRDAARQAGQGINVDSLYTPETSPLDAVKQEAPEMWMDMAGKTKFENKRGDGLDDVERDMLNKRVTEGATPDEISKLLKHFRTPGVSGGTSGGYGGERG